MPDPTAPSDDAAAPPGPPPMRASDADRHATVHVLQDAVARGLLTPDEGSERMAAAYASRHLGDLPPLTADLPPASAPAPAAVASGWRPLATQTWIQMRASASTLASGGWHSPRTLAVVAAVLVALVLVVLLGAGALDVLMGGPHGHSGFGPHH